MKPGFLRQFAKRYGTAGLLLVGIYLAARHFWYKKRPILMTCLLVLAASVYTLASFYHPSISRGDHRLYLGRPDTEVHTSSQPLEQRVLEYWEESSRTDEVRGLAREFTRTVERQDRVRAVQIGSRLCRLFHPGVYWIKDGQGILRAVQGQIYLEQGWLEEAEREFQSVLATVPPGEPHWGKSYARKMSTYGLAHTCALRGSYGSALTWLARAPGEYNGGCGNANEAEAARNYPLQVVWQAAQKPFSTSVPELKAIMEGQFTPMESELNGDTSEAQRQHAAAEAGLTLGCLYAKVGRCADAEACWKLVAANAVSQPETATLAQAMLGYLRHN